MFGITIDENGFKELKKLYEEAVQKKQPTFIFQGHELLTAFAKYMIQYWEQKNSIK